MISENHKSYFAFWQQRDMGRSVYLSVLVPSAPLPVATLPVMKMKMKMGASHKLFTSIDLHAAFKAPSSFGRDLEVCLGNWNF